jgi:hypothetical protein
MAVLSALRRFARLGFWIGLSAGAMLADACSSGVKGKAQDAAPDVPVADALAKLQLPDAKADSPRSDAGAVDADNSPADAGQTDLWDIICE